MATEGGKPFSNKQAIALALCKHLAVDQSAHGATFGDDSKVDVKSLYTSVLKSAGKWSPEKESDEAMRWVGFSESFLGDSQPRSDALSRLNEDLSQKSVLLGNGLTLSEVDVIVFAAIHSSVVGLSKPDKEKLPHLIRWVDYVQNNEDFGTLFGKILVDKAVFERPVQGAKSVAKPEVDTGAKKTKKSTETEAVDKDKELSVSLLNIQVGVIRKASKHPSADSLLVEEIDVGDAKLRQVVSGLAKYCSPEDLTNRRVVLITNVKPGKLRDVVSEGLVLCASSEDHTIVEPLLPPEDAKIGERVSFSGIDGKPEDVLNPKKKQLEKITPNLFTDDKGVATFKGIPFMTSGGPCTSSIPKASIK